MSDRFSVLWPSCLIRQQIRGEWVPAARTCRFTNLEIGRISINMLVTDIILLCIMLAGLLRLRRGAGGSFYLLHLLWKQVGHGRPSLLVSRVNMLSHCIRHSPGCHLARYCHRRRTPANGKPGQLDYCTFTYHRFYAVVSPLFEFER